MCHARECLGTDCHVQGYDSLCLLDLSGSLIQWFGDSAELMMLVPTPGLFKSSMRAGGGGSLPGDAPTGHVLPWPLLSTTDFWHQKNTDYINSPFHISQCFVFKLSDLQSVNVGLFDQYFRLTGK